MNNTEPLTRALIRGVFLRNGFRIEDGRDDLPDCVYEAAFELLDAAGAPAVQGEPEIEPYDAGSLNDFGGGDVGWWHDYIRAELDRAYEFYLIQLAAAPQPAPTTPTGGESDE